MKKNNISEKLLSSILEKEFAKNELSDEEMDLIQRYCSNDLTDEELENYKKLVQENEKFKITSNVINYEYNRERPRHLLFRLFFSYQKIIDKIVNWISDLFNIAIPDIAPQPSFQLLSIKYSSPIISVTAMAIIVFIVQSTTHSFYPLTNPQRTVFISNQWRSADNTLSPNDLSELEPLIRYEDKALIIDWKQTNMNADSYTIAINNKVYTSNIDSISIKPFDLNIDTLSIEITDYNNKEPISKLKISYLIKD